MSEAWFFALWSDLLADDWHGATVQCCTVDRLSCSLLCVQSAGGAYPEIPLPTNWGASAMAVGVAWSCNKWFHWCHLQGIWLNHFSDTLGGDVITSFFDINGCQHSVVCDPNSWLNPSVDVIDAWQILACLLSFNRCPFHSSKCHNRLLTLILQFYNSLYNSTIPNCILWTRSTICKANYHENVVQQKKSV